MAQPLAPERARTPVGKRLMAGPDFATGHESIEDHERRLGRRPAGHTALIAELERSGVRGRGGAWFPAGRKWAAVARSSQKNAVIVVNASEGEALSSKDQTLMKYRPHLVLDGAVIAAETLGATDIVLYTSRGDRATDRAVEQALAERARAGAPEMPIRVLKTAHRYIAGESSAAINRTAGGQSKPKFMVARAAEKGVYDRPTLVQNAETLAHVAMIARYGADWFRRLGTPSAPGSTLMTFSGNVRHPGVYEVVIGATLGEVLNAIGGVVSRPAGALIGGYFGHWFPAAALPGLPLDPDRLRTQYGASLGCGIVALLHENSCPIAEASKIFSYLAAESSGQCGPCVNGLNAIAASMESITESAGDRSDVDRVRRWIDMVRDRGACHHPDGAVGMLASALAAFPEHVDYHASRRACPGVRVPGFPPPPSPGDRWR